jgi:hypothetical protein
MNQLNLIINALQNCSEFQPKNYYEIDKALAAARELKALKPVAQIRVKNGHWIDTPVAEVKDLADGVHNLYALDEVKHD